MVFRFPTLMIGALGMNHTSSQAERSETIVDMTLTLKRNHRVSTFQRRHA